MAEFKFSCPQCNQHIQCDTGYSGMQINCPTCQKPIIVPQAPRVTTPPPAAAAPPPAPPQTLPGMATRVTAPSAGRRFAGAPSLTGAPPPKPKSNALRNILVITASIVVLAGLGAGGWFGYTKIKAHKTAQEAKKGNPAAQVTAPSSTATIQALGILGKVYAAYTNSTSATADGTMTLFLDLSNLTMADLTPGARPNPNAAARNRRGNLPRTITDTTGFSIKRGQSNWYCLVFESAAKIDRQTISNTTAMWSADKGTYTYNETREMGAPPQRNYVQTADAAAASDAAEQFKFMRHAFDDPTVLTKIIKDLGQGADEPVNGLDCYTITAKVLGQKVEIWVDKASYEVEQAQITLGGNISDADIDDAFSLIATVMTNVSPDRLAQAQMQAQQMEMAKTQFKMYTPVVAKIRGTITVTYQDIQRNPTLTADDFEYAVPSGVRLIRIPTPNRPATPATSTADFQRDACINNLRQIDGAKNEWALEKGKANGTPVTAADIAPYLQGGALPKCPGGGTYTIGKIGEKPTCSIPGHVLP